MARLILGTGESFGVLSGNVTIYGTGPGAETVTVTAGATVNLDSSFNGGGDVVVLTGNASSYTAIRSGSAIVLTDAAGGSVTIPVGTTAATLKFADVTTGRSLAFNRATSSIELGDQAIGFTSVAVTAGSAGGSTAGQSITLTSGIDVKTGGAGNDVFYGTVTSAASSDTYTAGDDLTGGAGTDTLTIAANGTGSITAPTVAMQGIETVQVSNAVTSGTVTVDLSLADADLATIGTSASSIAGVGTTFTNLAEIVDVSMKGKGNLTVTHASAVVTGTSDALNLTLNGVGSADANATFNTNGIERLAINSATSANYLTLGTDADAATGVTISGDKALTLNLGASSDAKVVDASAATAAVNVLAIGNTATTVTGGAGNDTFSFGSGFFDASTGTGKDVIDGGAGTDTIAANTATVTDAKFARVSNVEVLQLSGTGSITLGTGLDGTGAVNAGIRTISDSTGAADAVSITIGSGYAGASVTVNLNGTGDTVISSGATGSTVTINADVSDVNGLTITGGTGSTETLRLMEDGGTGTLGAGVANLNSISVLAGTGVNADAGVTLVSNATVASGQTLTIDASALTSEDSALSLTINGATAGSKYSVVGGAGADTIVLSTGTGVNDTVVAGAGDDDITGGQGSDNIDAGDGDDIVRITAAASLTSADTIVGGAGDDTLVLGTGSLSSSQFTNVSGFESLVFSGDATLTGNIPFTTFDLSATSAAQTLTLSSGYTAATTVDLGTGDGISASASSAALTVNVAASALTGTLSLGSGTDVVNITTDADSPSAITLGSGASIDRINVLDGGDLSNGAASGQAGYDLSITLSNGYNRVITVDASALDAGTFGTGGDASGNFENLTFNGSVSGTGVNVTGGAGMDSITGGSGNDTIVGGAGADTLTAGAGYDNISGGEGNDSIVFAGTFNGEDTVAGGDGDDTLSVSQSTDGVRDIDFLNTSSIETLALGSTASTVTLDSRAQSAGINAVTIANGTADVQVDARAFTSGITITELAGTGINNTTLRGGAGNDVFAFSGSGLTSADFISGGAGTDTIRLSNGTGAGTAVNASVGTGISGIENITVLDASTGTGGGGSVTLTIDAGTTGVSSLTISGADLDATEVFTVNANAATGSLTVSVEGGAGNDVITGTKNADTLNGNGGNDSLVGGSGNDTLSGGAGVDTLVGGAGADNLTGGTGNDVFYLGSASTGDVLDTITDLSNVTGNVDQVRVSMSVTAGATVDFTDKGDASSVSDGLALLSSVRGQYFLNTGSSQIAIDVDGNGLIQASDYRANVTGATGLSSAQMSLELTVSGDGSATAVTAGAGTDYVSLEGTGNTVTLKDVDQVSATTNMNGSVLNLASGNAASLTITSYASGGTGFVVNGTETAGDTVTISGTGAGGFRIDLGSGSDSVTISGVGNTGSVFLDTATGTDTITFGGTNNVVTALGDAASGNAGMLETVTFGTGIDKLIFGAAFTTGSDLILLGGATGSGGITMTSIGSGDTINIDGAGRDTIKFGTSSVGTGTVGFTIEGFGTGAAGDILNLGDLVTGTGLTLDYNQGAGGAAAANNDVVQVYGTGFGVDNIGNGLGDVNFSTGTAHLVLLSTASGSSSVQIYLVDSTLDGTGDTWSAADIRLVGTVSMASNNDAGNITADNISL